MSQVQIARGFGDATTAPWFALTQTQLQTANASLDASGAAGLILRSTAAALAIGGVAGLLAGHFFGGRNRKRARTTGGLIGLGAASAYASYALLPYGPAAYGETGKWVGYAGAAGLLGYGAWRAFR